MKKPLTEGTKQGAMSAKDLPTIKRPVRPPPAGGKPVDCKNLVPPRIGVERWHCMLGDFYEGDCPIYLEKASACTYQEKTMKDIHPPPPKPEQEVVKKVVEKYEFGNFRGGFEILPTGWIDYEDPQGNRAIIHKDQIIAMANTLNWGKKR